MIWWVILIEAVVFAGIFKAIVLPTALSDKKHSASSIHNYPPDIQEEYFKTHERVDVSYNSKRVILTKSFGVFGLMVWIGIYDTFFLDWVLFANVKAFRLEGTEHMDEAYHQKWFHLKGMLFPGIVFALIPAALVGLFTMLIGGIYG